MYSYLLPKMFNRYKPTMSTEALKQGWIVYLLPFNLLLDNMRQITEIAENIILRYIFILQITRKLYIRLNGMPYCWFVSLHLISIVIILRIHQTQSGVLWRVRLSARDSTGLHPFTTTSSCSTSATKKFNKTAGTQLYYISLNRISFVDPHLSYIMPCVIFLISEYSPPLITCHL